MKVGGEKMTKKPYSEALLSAIFPLSSTSLMNWMIFQNTNNV